MGYDATTQLVVLFGGTTGNSTFAGLSDTWTWDGTTWTPQSPATHPAARCCGGSASTPNGVVIFGGYNWTTGKDLGDTWTWR